ncbi:hypothetical protein GCM10007047_22070 [Cerasicoccus arenae]|uniref:Glycosyl transferase family 1 domain-containing protein n=2 Tax=Cerasicoccus arenae TaxID=424488 RepID=A0A8J3DCW3_9BACT|nr:hypothetical protein GCM10007047_22070 [Cerasicoccus arenae]
MVHLYKAVDLDAFQPSPVKAKLTSPYRVLFVKNQWHIGGLDVLLQALANLSTRSFTLSVIGVADETEQDEIRKLASKAGYLGELIQLGIVPREQIIEHYATADFFCVPSRREALGVAFLEALAAGLPVVATDAGGIPEVLKQGEAGFMARPGDVDSLVVEIQQCLDNDEDRLSRRQVGLEHVKSFSKERMFKRMSEIMAKANAQPKERIIT